MEAYERATGRRVEPVFFVPHPTKPWLGASPDGRIGRDGLLEIKCPVTREVYGEVPPYYMAQVQGQLECDDREWCDFTVWTPRGGTIQRIVRSERYWRWMESRLAEFWAYVLADIPPPRLKRREFPDDRGLIISSSVFTSGGKFLPMSPANAGV